MGGYLIGGDDIADQAVEMNKVEGATMHHTHPLATGTWFKSSLDRIGGWGSDFDESGEDRNVLAPSKQVIEDDKESLYKCGGVSKPAMFSIPTYTAAIRTVSVDRSSRPSNPVGNMTDGHSILL